jgi:mono/diheme cytochrome c family protein
MKRAMKVVGWLVGILVLLALVAVAAAHLLSQRKLNRQIDVNPAPVAFVDDETAFARGKYLFDSRGCAECHGEDGAGRLFIDAPNGFRVWTPNISPGPGSVVAKYTEVDWVLAIRHGVRPDKRPLLVMPSEDYNRLTDADLAAVVTYTRRLPPVAGEAARIEMPLMLKALYAAGMIPDAAERIDHTLPPAQPVAEGPTRQHGEYVANMCKGCHGMALKGGPVPGGPPDWPPAVDLTTAATYAAYDTVEKFRSMMRSGKRPTGEMVRVMPFPTLKQLNDVDMEALYLYLKSLPGPSAARQ